MVAVELVPVQMVDQIWPHVAPRVGNCLKKAPGEIHVGDAWVNCRNGSWLLTVATAEANVLGIAIWRFATVGYLECILFEGESNSDWTTDLLNLGMTIATANGLKGIGGSGRVGLIKLLKRQFKQTKIVRQTYVIEAEK